jgi:multiple sugar transport system permease protein
MEDEVGSHTMITTKTDVDRRLLVQPAFPRRRQKKSRLQAPRRRVGILMAAPAFLLVAATMIIPIGQAIYYSFTDWDGTSSQWVGLRNYQSLLHDPTTGQIVGHNALLLLSIPFGMVTSLAAAFVLNEMSRGKNVVRSIILLPVALSWVVVGLVGRAAFAPNGVLNQLLSGLGLQGLEQDWLGNVHTAFPAVIITFNCAVWGLNTVIFLTGLATLDRDSVLAARLDGANTRQVLWHVVVPDMRRFIVFDFLITVVMAFTGLFGLIYVMTAGGPGYATTTLEFAVYQNAFAVGNFGLGAALGFVLFGAVVVSLIAAGVLGRLGSRVRR